MKTTKQLKLTATALTLSAVLMILPGCSTTVPLKANFPEVPTQLMEPAPELKPVPADKKEFSDLLENVNENYGTYYDVRERFNAWIEWYKTQKEIFESVK